MVVESASTDNALKVDFLLMGETTNSGTTPKIHSLFPVNCQNGSAERQLNNAAKNSVSPSIVQNSVTLKNDSKNAGGATSKKAAQDGTSKSTRRDAAVGDNLIHEKMKSKNIPSADVPELINCLFPKLGQLLASDKS
uniref:Uncharacterized protein n=1 Tax=Romanomermis culicivorax TaxID=13658 RepID=A0A915IST9_ROMCU